MYPAHMHVLCMSDHEDVVMVMVGCWGVGVLDVVAGNLGGRNELEIASAPTDRVHGPYIAPSASCGSC